MREGFDSPYPLQELSSIIISMISRRKVTPLIAVSVAYLIWGLNIPLIKTSLEAIPIAPLLFVKFAFGGIFFSLIARRNWKRLKGKVRFRVIMATFFGYALTASLFYLGIKLSDGLDGSLIYLLAPIVLYLMSVEILKEKFNSKLLFGLIVSFAGAVLIVCEPLITGSASTKMDVVGNLLIVLAVFADVFGTILIKPVMNKMSAAQMTALRFNIAALMIAPLAIKDIGLVDLSGLQTQDYVAVGYNLIFATLIAFFIYHWGLKKMKAEETSPLEYLSPVAGAVGSIFILGEVITAIMVAGVALVLIGLYFGEVRKSLPIHVGHHR